MRLKPALLLILLWTSATLSTFAQSGGRSPISISAIGHMSVTLLSPAALTASQNLEFNDIQLRSASTSAAIDCDMTMASVHVSGTPATYAVTVSNNNLGFNQNGKALSIGQFSARTSLEDSGSSSIYIGATMSIVKRNALAVAENNGPLAITINYN